jgi:2-alkyl-3-oxoalkanoate reductase
VRVFVAGATGTLGVPVLRELKSRGHDTVGMTRSEDRRKTIEELGATAVVADALDAQSTTAAVKDARPDAVLHLLTALPKNGPIRPGQLKGTDEVRDRGTHNLLQAAVDAGARRFVGESFFGIYGVARGDGPFTEDAELGSLSDDDPMAPSWRALLSLESQILGASREGKIEGMVIRYAGFHGPEVPSSRYLLKNVKRRTLPLLAGGGGVVSWIDVDDGARLTVDVMERGAPGEIYNASDDEPVTFRDYATELARLAGAKPPRSVPRWLASLVASYGTRYMSDTRLPVSNEKAKRELGWVPERPTYREALAALVSAAG